LTPPIPGAYFLPPSSVTGNSIVLSYRTGLAAALVLAFAAACKESAPPVSHAPTHLITVSGSGQSGDVGAALAAPIVVQARDAADRPVENIPITWTVTGGGTVSPATSTTDTAGKASVVWTLAPAPGLQAVTATSAQITGAGAVSFIATNGPTIAGSVSVPVTTNAFLASRVPTAARVQRPRPPTTIKSDRIVVGFRTSVLGVAAVGSTAYRSMAASRSSAVAIRDRLATIGARQPIRDAEVSPAMAAARVRVTDATQIETVIAALRQDPSVAWVERDIVISIRDGLPQPKAIPWEQLSATSKAVAGGATAAVRLPNDPNYWLQYWNHNMIDIPRAWTITTGSPSVIVASIDQGIRFDHPELAPNLTNDGYDFVTGDRVYATEQSICAGGTFDTINGDGDGPDPDPTDPDDLFFDDSRGCWLHESVGDHGVWTAGIIGGVGNDGSGGTGVNWAVKIRPIRVLGVTGEGFDFDVAQGILYAAGLPASGQGGTLVQPPSRAPIISLSLGSPEYSDAMLTAVNAATAAGSLVIASAGNDGLDFPSYPAAFPGVMGVAAVGQDGQLATYSNAGYFISVAAPGGDFRLDDNGGGAVWGPWWDFVRNRPTFSAAYGTSASAPHVAGVAALLLAQEPSLTATDLRQRIEQYATRPSGSLRNDTFGWGILNAYSSLTRQNGPPRQTVVRVLSTTGAVVKTANVGSNGSFAFTRLAPGSYFLQAGQDESSDGVIGVPGRRFAWAGTFAQPSTFAMSADQVQTAAILLATPTEAEPNDDFGTANVLSPGSYVVGQIFTPDRRDVYKILIPAAGQYTFETSGLVGTCGAGIELDTVLQLQDTQGTTLARNDNFTSATSRACSRLTQTLSAGTYFVTVTGTDVSGLAFTGRYRLEVRAGP